MHDTRKLSAEVSYRRVYAVIPILIDQNDLEVPVGLLGQRMQQPFQG